MKKLLCFFLLCFSLGNYILFGQERVVTGRVTSSEDHAPLIGATVVIKGTTTGTATDVDGKYQISVPKEGGILVFSFIGYLEEENQIGSETVVDISLIPNIESINEVVVVGYGTQKKSDLTGSVSSIKTEDIQKAPVTTSDQLLQGRAAGVTVTSNSGTPGASSLIRVRGIGTINDASPLFVVDGFPVDGISFLNPSDIASMEILKDASATAIYGSRGANGVILITTKTGKKGQEPIISFDSYYEVSKMWKKPELLNASQWAQLRTEAEENGGTPVTQELLDYESFGKGTDWVNEVTRQAISHNLNISVTGGSDKITYFASANNFSQEGIIKKTDYNRSSFRLNTSIKAKNWLTFGENLTFDYSKMRTVNEGDEWSAILIRAVTSDPTTPVKWANGTYSSSEYVQMVNPVAGIEHTHNSDITAGLAGNFFADIDITKDIKFKSNMGVQYSNSEYNDFTPTYNLYFSDGTVNSASSVEVSTISRTNTESKAWSWSNYLTYTKEIDEHSVSIMAGTESSKSTWDNFTGQKTNLISEEAALRNFDNALDPNGIISGSPSDQRMLSYFGRINYDYADKYLLTFNFRRDGSSSFGTGNRFGNFPSFSAGWKIDKEKFMSNFEFISACKLRAGWGKIGNDKIPQYGYYSRGYTGSKYVFNGEIYNGVYFPGLVNKDLRWEETETTNVGLDLGLFEDKITFTADYFVKNTNDMLVNVPVPLHAGVQIMPYRNIGSMENKGLELTLDYKEAKGDFKYDIGINFASYKNKVTDLGEQTAIQAASLRDGGYVSMTQVGEPVAQFWGYKTDGLFQTEEDVQNWTDNNGNLLQPDAVPGDIRYAKNDTSGLFVGNIGNPLPKFSYGLNVDLSYKNFDLTLFVQGVYGNKIFNGTMVYTDRPDVATNLSTRMLERWTGPNSTNDAHHPRLSTSNASNILYSDRYVENGSYLRLKNIQIGYTLPEKLSQPLHIEKLRIYAGASNLLTYTKYQGFDPEIGQGYDGSLDIGIDRATYPQSRNFMVGFNLVF